MNLLNETISILEENKKSASDVLWVSKNGYYFTWEDFVELTKDLEYHNGYGGQEISASLTIGGKGFWMERGEYDGSEWWEFRRTPKKPKEYKKPKDLLHRWRDEN